MRFFVSSMLFVFFIALHGCTVVKVVDTAASASIGAATGAVKITGKVIDAAIPDGESQDTNKEK